MPGQCDPGSHAAAAPADPSRRAAREEPPPTLTRSSSKRSNTARYSANRTKGAGCRRTVEDARRLPARCAGADTCSATSTRARTGSAPSSQCDEQPSDVPGLWRLYCLRVRGRVARTAKSLDVAGPGFGPGREGRPRGPPVPAEVRAYVDLGEADHRDGRVLGDLAVVQLPEERSPCPRPAGSRGCRARSPSARARPSVFTSTLSMTAPKTCSRGLNRAPQSTTIMPFRYFARLVAEPDGRRLTAVCGAGRRRAASRS